jgi:hypothetical protein
MWSRRVRSATTAICGLETDVMRDAFGRDAGTIDRNLARSATTGIGFQGTAVMRTAA